MATRETIIIKTSGSTYSSLPNFIPRVKWARVVSVIDGNSLWIATSLMGGVYKFLVHLKGVQVPKLDSCNPSERRASLIAKKELRGLVEGEIVELSRTVWGNHGSLLSVVSVAGLNVNDYIVNQGLSSNPILASKLPVIKEDFVRV